MDQMTPPPSSPDEMPAQPKTITLTPDLRDALGLTDCEPGESYTIQIQAKDGSDGDTQSFDVLSSMPDEAPDATPGEGEGDGEGDNEDGAPPSGADLPPPENEEGDGAIPGGDEILGYPRKKKSPREGLPDTKKMRDLL